MKKRVVPKLIYLLIALSVSTGFFSCDKRDAAPQPELSFETGPVIFMKLGGVISTFTVVFESLGTEPIEEYGIVYSFDDDVKDNYPDLKDQKAVFDLPARQYSNDKTVNIGFPVGAKALGVRAFVKLKSGKVKYAEPLITYF
jgi:hypothetical protein